MAEYQRLNDEVHRMLAAAAACGRQRGAAAAPAAQGGVLHADGAAEAVEPVEPPMVVSDDEDDLWDAPMLVPHGGRGRA